MLVSLKIELTAPIAALHVGKLQCQIAMVVTRLLHASPHASGFTIADLAAGKAHLCFLTLAGRVCPEMACPLHCLESVGRWLQS